MRVGIARATKVAAKAGFLTASAILCMSGPFGHFRQKMSPAKKSQNQKSNGRQSIIAAHRMHGNIRDPEIFFESATSLAVTPRRPDLFLMAP